MMYKEHGHIWKLISLYLLFSKRYNEYDEEEDDKMTDFKSCFEEVHLLIT